MSQESQETSRYQRSKQKKPIDTTKPLGKVQAFLSKFTLSPRNPIRRFWRRYHIGKILFILVAMLVLTVGSYLFYIAKTTNVSDLQDALKATTVIYDKEGNQAGSLSGQKGTYVELDAISDSLENAVIATEDRTFYENSGVNVKRFLLAIVSMGRFGGGSTITQQLAKNAFLTQEQNDPRRPRILPLFWNNQENTASKSLPCTSIMPTSEMGFGVLKMLVRNTSGQVLPI